MLSSKVSSPLVYGLVKCWAWHPEETEPLFSSFRTKANRPNIQLWQAQGWRQLPFPSSDTEDPVVEGVITGSSSPLHLPYPSSSLLEVREHEKYLIVISSWSSHMEEGGVRTEAFSGFENRFAIAPCTASVPETDRAGLTRNTVFSSVPHLRRSSESFLVGHIRPHMSSFSNSNQEELSIF